MKTVMSVDPFSQFKCLFQDAEGCGRLVFAWLRGIKGQLHSCAQNVLLIMMQSFCNESLPIDSLERLMSHTLSHLVVEIHPGGLTFLWDAIKVCNNFSFVLKCHCGILLKI